MTRKEMIEALRENCNKKIDCLGCALFNEDNVSKCYDSTLTDKEIEENYNKVFGNVKEYERAYEPELITAEIKDSGARTVFETGAVRDIQEDKGRCDLLPLNVVAKLARRAGYNRGADEVLFDIADFMQKGRPEELYAAIVHFCDMTDWTFADCILEVSMHYKQGAEKYGERNWEKGIKLHSYIDSGVRHFLKYIDGQKDERHDRAFVWNMLGAIWTMNHRPKMIDIPFELLGSQEGAENES